MTGEAVEFCGESVALGKSRDLLLPIGESYTGDQVNIPFRVTRGTEPGPTLLVTGAIHGDELNGIGIVRQLMLEPPPLRSGTLVLVPVVNVLGLARHSRYLPDRRDLNRCFPGSGRGSLASRVAAKVFRELVKPCTHAIDLHTATAGRTNFPHVRADLSNDAVRELAFAFGCEVVVDHPGHPKCLRRAACKVGIPSMLLEVGESLKIEAPAVELGVRGVSKVLFHLGMTEQGGAHPAYQTDASSTVWVRAKRGGILRLHVGPGSIVDRGAKIGTIDNLVSGKSTVVKASSAGIVIGLRTLPTVKRGDPICHLAHPTMDVSKIRDRIANTPTSLHSRIRAAEAVEAVEPATDDVEPAAAADKVTG